MADHTIHLRSAPSGAGYRVQIEPTVADEASHDREFDSYKEARGYSVGLRMVRGWPIVDLSAAPVARTPWAGK